MHPDKVTELINTENNAIAAFDDQIRTARERGQEDMVAGLEDQKQPHVTERDRLQSQVLPQVQKELADEEAKAAAEAAAKEQKKKDGVSGFFG